MTVFGVKVTTLGVKWMTLFGSKNDYCQGQNKEIIPPHRVVNDYIEESELENDPKM